MRHLCFHVETSREPEKRVNCDSNDGQKTYVIDGFYHSAVGRYACKDSNDPPHATPNKNQLLE